ncbi:hypothetical protein ILUMI_11491, partial [Ignelater luminosus]
ETAHVGSIVIIKTVEDVHVEEEIQTKEFQVTAVSTILANQEVNMAAAYIPPRHNLKTAQDGVQELLPSKGRELHKAVEECSASRPTTAEKYLKVEEGSDLTSDHPIVATQHAGRLASHSNIEERRIQDDLPPQSIKRKQPFDLVE